MAGGSGVETQFEAKTEHEQRSVGGLAAIFFLRLLGLYMVLPVLSIHASTLAGATPLLIGLSLGAYGFSQAILQVPYGLWSDRWGRKPVIATGLLIFAAGSVIAALADSALWLVIGRTLQGAGAIASAVVAMIADVTREKVRTRAMAILGASVGVSLTVGLSLGPGLAARFSVEALFWVTAGLSILATLYLLLFIPEPKSHAHHEDLEWTSGQLAGIFRSMALIRLNLGALLLHTVVTALFVVGPLLMTQYLPPEKHGMIYLRIMPAAVLLMGLSSIWADRRGRLREVILLGALSMGGAGALLLFMPTNFTALVWAIGLAIGAVALGAPAQPTMVTRLVAANARGTASGLFHLCQFGGSFLGGLLGGVLADSATGLGWTMAVGGALWLLSNFGLPQLGNALPVTLPQASMADTPLPDGGADRQ